MVTKLLAGNETSSTSLSWMIARLVEEPAIQERLYQDVTAHVVIDEFSATRLSLEQIDAMKYLEGFIVRLVHRIQVRTNIELTCSLPARNPSPHEGSQQDIPNCRRGRRTTFVSTSEIERRLFDYEHPDQERRASPARHPKL